MNKGFDVIVIGGGHAGCEAAAAAARMGARTALVTHSFSTIGEMSCNPAIGGLGKGHLVREIDALDGLMGRVADEAGIQFRVLNRSKGPAVQGPRAQADRKLYRKAMQAAIAATPGLEVIEAAVEDLIVEDGAVTGIVTGDGRRFPARAVVLTTGTFLRGLIHIGERKIPAGRIGEAPALGLSTRLYALGLAMGRLKTGTPPRLDGRTIRLDGLEVQNGDRPPRPFSFLTETIATPQIACRITHTNAATHAIIERNLARAPMYSGAIESVGPALLSLDRGQDRALQGARQPSDLSRARRPRRRHRLSERHLDLAARRRSARLPRDHPGARDGARHQAGLRHRIRLHRSARTLGRARSQGASRACSWRARSTARPATRKPPGRGSSPA